MTGWKPYECEFCGVKVYTKALLDHHKWLLHGQPSGSVMGGPVTFRCATCAEEFSERKELLAHLSLHRASQGPHEPQPTRAEPAAAPKGSRRSAKRRVAA